VRNPVFKAQVDALFEKTAWGQDPAAVAAANPELRSKILRGLELSSALSSAGASAGKALSGAGNLAERVLMGGSPDGMLSKGLGGVSSFIQKHPTAAIGTAALAPILAKAFNAEQQKNQRELMDAYQDPTRVITASLEDFLEKKAAFRAESGSSFGKDLMGGVGKALGSSLVGLLAGSIGTHFSNTRNILMDEPRRKRLLETLCTSDAVIKDAIARHPDSKAMILEAYGTMTKFAPALSLDINAVRSFLREAVMGGSGVNYATIKNLVDTERAIADSKPHYGGK
jgi:hypothetical protein